MSNKNCGACLDGGEDYSYLNVDHYFSKLARVSHMQIPLKPVMSYIIECFITKY